jgi:CRP-like cAMP-binding protein
MARSHYHEADRLGHDGAGGAAMPCDPAIFEEIPIFSLLDADERAVLAEQVELRRFAARQRIYRVGDPGAKAYVVTSGKVEVVVIDDDNQEVVLDTPTAGEMFGLASMLSAAAHATTATALEDTTAIEVDRHDLTNLLQKKPLAGLDMLTMVGRHIRSAQMLVRTRAGRNPNEVIDEQVTWPDRLADGVARFGGSWKFIITFAVVLVVYAALNVALAARAWDPYPFILLNLFLMMSQNRQDARDRLRGELDFSVNRKAEGEIIQLAAKLNRIEDKLDDIHRDVNSR